MEQYNFTQLIYSVNKLCKFYTIHLNNYTTPMWKSPEEPICIEHNRKNSYKSLVCGIWKWQILAKRC